MSKKGFLDSIEVKTPCLQSWNEMRGSDQIRFCDHCTKDVHNLSRMTRKQARKIVAQSDDGICVRYIRRPDGRIQTIKNTFHQITRQTGIAAGILGTSLSFSTLAYAQEETNPSKDLLEKIETVEVVKQEISELKELEIATVSGTVVDQAGAVIPNATATLFNEKTGEIQKTSSNGEGFYEFKNVSAGTFKVTIESPYFKTLVQEKVIVNNAGETKVDASLEVGGTETALMGVVAFAAEYELKLLTAVSNDDLEAVKLFISKGENVNAKDKNYNSITALFVAVENGNLEIVETLLNAGAKVNARDKERRTPLMNLDSDATPELVNLLLRHGAKINAVDKQGNTVLRYAACYDNAEVVRILINGGANLNAQNKKGRTALMEAAYEENLEVVKALLQAGANVDLHDKERKSVLELTDTDEIKELLIAYGATESQPKLQ